MARKTKAKKAGKAKRTYTRRAPVARGGARAGAGRKSSEMHFAQLGAKVDTLTMLVGVLAEALNVKMPEQKVAVASEAPKVEAAPEAPKPEKAKRGKKVKTNAELPNVEKVPTVKVAEEPMPAPVFAPPIAALPQVVVTHGPASAPPVQVVTQAPVQQPVPVQPVAVQPVVFTPPPQPAPLPVTGFVGVAPLVVPPVPQPQSSLPIQPTAPDFNEQFAKLDQQK